MTVSGLIAARARDVAPRTAGMRDFMDILLRMRLQYSLLEID